MTGCLCVGSYEDCGAAADDLRRRVFLDEQGVPEEEIFDGLSENAVHIVLFENGMPLATARLHREEDGWCINCVAVEKSRRGQHLGAGVVQAALSYAAAHGGGAVTLSAQHTARGFYEKLGFVPCGEPIVFASGFILIPMRRTVEPQTGTAGGT